MKVHHNHVPRMQVHVPFKVRAFRRGIWLRLGWSYHCWWLA